MATKAAFTSSDEQREARATTEAAFASSDSGEIEIGIGSGSGSGLGLGKGYISLVGSIEPTNNRTKTEPDLKSWFGHLVYPGARPKRPAPGLG